MTEANETGKPLGLASTDGLGGCHPERANACDQGCNGCDDCTDYEDEDDDEECTYCRGTGTDRYTDNLIACPYCDGSGTA